MRKIVLSCESKDYARVVFDIVKIFFAELTWHEFVGTIDCDGEVLNIYVAEESVIAEIIGKAKIIESFGKINENEVKRIIKLAVYKLLQKVYDKEGSPWGILTGVRPTKILHRLWDKGFSSRQIKKILLCNYLVSSSKAEKILNISQLQRRYILSSEEAKKLVSVYISIPFCPTKCHYCSFPSFEIGKWGRELSEYLRGLEKEIVQVGRALQEQGITVQTVYVGGGTPTILNSSQLGKLLDIVNKNLCSPNTREITVEAGRPDTIDEDKLRVLKAAGVERISINPQTMINRTLEKVGRMHTVQDILEKMQIARRIDFKIINMDLIIGLPGENLADFINTLSYIDELKPENVTIHTLAIKRASKFKDNDSLNINKYEVEKMAEYAEEWSSSRLYQPYYMYRQKQMLANQENVGYCREDYLCIYNIQMIEERQTIWGLGVGSASKIVNPENWTLQSFYNPKDLNFYKQRLDDLINYKVDKIKGLG